MNASQAQSPQVDGLTLFAYDGGGSIRDTKPLEVKVSADNTDICAGGWDQGYNNGAGGYGYLSKETGTWKAHDALPDPHIAVLTAQVSGGSGDYSGLKVQFHWTMPGGPDDRGLSESPNPVPVGPDGKAIIKVVSGDDVSDGVSVSADLVDSSGESQAEAEPVTLNVKAPLTECKYKDEKGDFVTLPKDVDLITVDPKSPTIPLQTILTFKEVPVFGHHIKWATNRFKSYDGEPVSGGNYGHLSGDVSTTGQDGTATASFTKGTEPAQIFFSEEDSSVYLPTETSSASVETTSSSASISSEAKTLESKTRGSHPKRTYTTPKLDEYRWVHGTPSYDKPYSYPAPPGVEDHELLTNTLSLVLHGGVVSETVGHKPGLLNLGAETTSPYSYFTPEARRGDPTQSEGWWFSQVVGNDVDSAGYHFADVYFNRSAMNYALDPPRLVKYKVYRGAAFDIVLNAISVDTKNGRVMQFGPYVKTLRNLGIVSWHRWAGEKNRPDNRENEMHCIEPAMPYLKGGLRTQVQRFINNGVRKGDPGSGGYEPEPVNTNDPALAYFIIEQYQVDAVRDRFTGTKHKEFARIYHDAVRAPAPQLGPNP